MTSKNRKTIHFIIFSRLHSHDGGRETWLNNFIQESKRVNSNFGFIIYYYFDSDTRSDNLIESIYSYPDIFIKVGLPNQGNIFKSILRVLSFQTFVFKRIYQLINSEDIIIGIGNIHEALIPFIFRISKFKKRNVFTGVWLRSIFVKQQAALASPLRLKIMTAVEVKLLKPLSFILSNGWDTSKFYKDNYGINSFVIPNSLVLKKYKGIPDFDIQKESLVVSFIGRLSKEKGFTEFIDSVNFFNTHYSQYKTLIEFQVVGDGPLFHLINSEECVNLKYIGILANDQIPQYLGSIDCGVALTSALTIGGGGLSHGYLELLASGRVVIVWNNDIYKQIDSSDAVILIDEGDVASLARSYFSILTNKVLYQSKTRAAIKLSESFSIENHYSTFTKFIRNL